jgi:CRISPR-associated protein Cmr5
MRTIQQQRARHALTQVRDAIRKLGDSRNPEAVSKEQKEFRAHTQGLPFMIHANGLGQAYAFYLSKHDKPSYRAICDTLAAWLLAEGNPYHGQPEHAAEQRQNPPNGENSERLLDAIVGCDMPRYLLAQAEAIAYMSWVKRFADAFINDQ